MIPDHTVTFSSFPNADPEWCGAYSGRQGTVIALTQAEVLPCLQQVADAISSGLHAAGFISYEAAAGLGTSLSTLPSGDFPLLWFALFSQRAPVPPLPPSDESTPAAYSADAWQPAVSREDYLTSVMKIQAYIHDGHSYQVNYTFPLRFRFTGDPHLFFADLCRSQSSRYSAFLDTGRYQILSASPELFFSLKNGMLTCRPMKGTAPRGRWYEEDQQKREGLAASEKDRAENLMIVDLLRNDMGIVAETGTVQVTDLFSVETLPTLHQMTSTITAHLRGGGGLIELFQALFPCGSITGAPKKRSMEIISECETAPRGVYTGAIGHLSIGKDGCLEGMFNVAIRTILLDSTTGTGEMGIGSGITICSDGVSEYEECLLKSRFAQRAHENFALIETLLYSADEGLYLLDRHLARLSRSAAYFGFQLNLTAVREQLERVCSGIFGNHKIRLLLQADGSVSVSSEPLAAEKTAPLKVAFSSRTVDANDLFLYHKTTHRPLYCTEKEQHPECDEVLFTNSRGEVTEGTFTNIVARIDGRLVTPALQCGLLPGVFREELLHRGTISERTITRQELGEAEELFLINSVRTWQRVVWVE